MQRAIISPLRNLKKSLVSLTSLTISTPAKEKKNCEKHIKMQEMATLQEQLTKAKKLQAKSLQNDLFRFIKRIEKELLDRNKDQIVNESKDIFGNPIGFYSYAIEVISRGRKKKGEPFTGYETEDFFKGFYMQEVAGVLRFGSTDPKTSKILSSESWLSDELFGLSDENLKEVIEKRLLPFFIDNCRAILAI